MRNTTSAFQCITPTLQRGGVGVIPTDTIYGLAAQALNKKAVERVYKLRRRNPKKPFIILISGIVDLKKFGITTNSNDRSLLNKLWPGPVSIILPCSKKEFSYLHRGTKTLAFRYPKPKWLQALIQKTGPLISTSANWEGKSPAKTISAAKRYFSETVDFYVDIGKQISEPSTIVEFSGGKFVIFRQGKQKISRQFLK